METKQLQNLTFLRTLVGYLGEREQFGWWQSSFFSPSSAAFLSPVFPKTYNLTRSAGVTQAASLVHDERIGVGQAYHLFRLPEELEQRLHHRFHDQVFWQEIAPHLTSKDAAMIYLRTLADTPGKSDTGPVRIGDLHALHQATSWPGMAAAYLHAFQSDTQTYPYFSDTTL
jgi:hypothetical protein